MNAFRHAALCSIFVVAAGAQTAPPLRSLTTPVASDTGLFMVISGVRPLSNGTAIVNDIFRRRLLLFDSTLASFSVLADTGAAATKYPNGFAGIIPYLGDSTLFTDREAQALLVLDERGRIVRTMAAPRVGDLAQLMINPGSAATDPQGRLVYRVSRRTAAPPAPLSDSGKIVTEVVHDSAAIVRADFETRTVDTVATHGTAVQKRLSMSTGSGGRASTLATNPLPQTDEWAMLPDGTIAIVRGQDYHIDWVRPDGSRWSSPKMAFDWKRVTQEDKERMLDSAKQANAAAEARAAALRTTAGTSGGSGGRGDGSSRALDGAPVRAAPIRFPFTTVDAADMPDYYPPIRAGTVKSDPEGNVWILPTTSTLSANGLVYDVVNAKGEIVERVKLPPKRALLAVGAGGVVYMSNASNSVYVIERARIIR